MFFSDREKNQSFNKPTGKVKAQDVDYLDPFYVIGKKGKYLKLIKYSSDILKNGKLDYKKAEYYGWMHKSKLLLNQQSVTDVASNKKNKTLVLFSDTLTINTPDKYFEKDSVKVYKDLSLASVCGGVVPYSLIYMMKQSEDGKQTLVSKKPYIKADEVKQNVLGWIDNSLIKDIGTGLHVNTRSIPQDTIRFVTTKGAITTLNEFETFENVLLSDQYKTVKYSPVSSYSVRDSLVAFRARMALPVFDKSNNYIFNVNGGHISYRQFNKIANGLKHINIAFVFEGKEQTITQFPQIVNALQGLQPLFDQSDDSFSYRFSCVTTFDDSRRGSLRLPSGTELNSDYSDIINYLSDKANNKDKIKPLALTRTWAGLRKAVDSFDKYKDETNLIVLIGEKGFVNDEVDDTFMNKLLRNNCRILGFQIHAGDDNSYNNFVLDIESMIDAYSNAMLKTKGDILVSPEQVKRDNQYKEIADVKKQLPPSIFPITASPKATSYSLKKANRCPWKY